MSDSFSNDEAHELLPWFVSGTLESREAAAFATHLEKCAICREEAPFLQSVHAELAAHGDSFLAEHPEAEMLVGFVRGELDGAPAARIQTHLKLCATCATEARWVRGEAVAEVADDEPAAAVPSASGGPRPSTWFAAAAAAFAVLAVSFWLWRDAGRPTRVMHPQVVRGVERSEGPAARVQLRAEATTIPLLLEIDLPDDAFPVRVELVSGTGATAFRINGIERDDLLEGHLLVDCARTDCVPGRYELRVTSSAAGPPSLVFGLEIVAP